MYFESSFRQRMFFWDSVEHSFKGLNLNLLAQGCIPLPVLPNFLLPPWLRSALTRILMLLLPILLTMSLNQQPTIHSLNVLNFLEAPFITALMNCFNNQHLPSLSRSHNINCWYLNKAFYLLPIVLLFYPSGMLVIY